MIASFEDDSVREEILPIICESLRNEPLIVMIGLSRNKSFIESYGGAILDRAFSDNLAIVTRDASSGNVAFISLLKDERNGPLEFDHLIDLTDPRVRQFRKLDEDLITDVTGLGSIEHANNAVYDLFSCTPREYENRGAYTHTFIWAMPKLRKRGFHVMYTDCSNPKTIKVMDRMPSVLYRKEFPFADLRDEDGKRPFAREKACLTMFAIDLEKASTWCRAMIDKTAISSKL